MDDTTKNQLFWDKQQAEQSVTITNLCVSYTGMVFVHHNTILTRNLKTPPAFVPEDDQLTTGQAWDEWLEEIKREFRYFRITDPLDKKDALIIYGWKEIVWLEKSLPNPTDEWDEYAKWRRS